MRCNRCELWMIGRRHRQRRYFTSLVSPRVPAGPLTPPRAVPSPSSRPPSAATLVATFSSFTPERTLSAELGDPFGLLQDNARIVLSGRARRLAPIEDAR